MNITTPQKGMFDKFYCFHGYCRYTLLSQTKQFTNNFQVHKKKDTEIFIYMIYLYKKLCACIRLYVWGRETIPRSRGQGVVIVEKGMSRRGSKM